MSFLIRLIVNAVAFFLIATYLPGFHVSSFTAAIIAALIFGLVNAIIRPLVILFTLPLTILTLGLFIIIINALMFWLTASITPGFKVDGFGNALVGAIIMMIVGFVTSSIFRTAEHRA